MRSTLVILLLSVAACSRAAEKPAANPDAPLQQIKMNGPLIDAKVTMVAAWEFPRNPLNDKTLDSSKLSEEIKRGFKLFTNTPGEAPHLTGGQMSCTNCHMNAGQRERSMPLVGIPGMFPEYNRRSARLFSLVDRIVDCFVRSENATDKGVKPEDLPTRPEVLAIAAYLTWLSKGEEMYVQPKWRGKNAIAAEALVPVDKLDPVKGEAIYTERCVTCHGTDGQGVKIGDKIAGPLWGPNSWNDGAGAARVYTLAGMFKYSMPYLDPGRLTDEEAQHVAAYINSKPRPAFPYKDNDYKVEKLPVDAVYYTRAQQAAPSNLRGTH
jgi:thiosulfate dehydrogenase